MPLSSQMSRTGLSRHYASSGGKRHRSNRWAWLLTVAGIALVVFAIQWLSNSSTEESPSPTAPAAAEAATPEDEAPAAAAAPASAVRPAPTAPAVPSFTLGGNTPGAASAPAPASTNTTTVASASATTRPAASENLPPRQIMETLSDRVTEGSVAEQLKQGMDLIADGRMVEGRAVLSGLLYHQSHALSPADNQAIRDTLTSVNKELVFSRKVHPSDPITLSYRVQPGDRLVNIGRKHHVPYQFLEQINSTEARRLQVGQAIKVLKGPIHARVIKSDYRMDTYVMATGNQPIYLCSFAVGLGESDSTPIGKWLVEPGRKLQNPDWANPRTGQYYAANDPENPIGEYWLALKGIDENTQDKQGYGIHGTTEPESIGQMKSMGCVRLRDADIAQVYKMLEDGSSTVEIVR